MDVDLATLLMPLDLAALREQFRSARPTSFVCIDDLLAPAFAERVARSYPSFAEARQVGREFRAVNETGKVQVTDPGHFPDPVRELHELLASDAWLSVVSEITGIDRLRADRALRGGGMHLYGSGAHLDVHVDFNRIPDTNLYRRLNILVFLNEGWDESWGGEFELWDPGVRHLQHAFAPVFNRCVIFATSESSFHGVPAVRCPPSRSRNSFAAYYYTEEQPSGAAEAHTTIFRARPDEHLKGALWMPLERWMRQTLRGIRGWKQRLRD